MIDAASTARGVLLLALVAGARAAGAQDSRPSALESAVEAYFDAKDDADAERRLEALLADPAATAENLLAAVQAARGDVAGEVEDLVPFAGGFLGARYAAPKDHRRDGPRLPVVFDVNGGQVYEHFRRAGGFVAAFVPGYTPTQFSDEGRDAFLKVLLRAAHRMHGDPDRLWMTGFSWGGHASFDEVIHRPHWLRGVLAFGGGPRRTWFRAFSVLRGVEVRMFCGASDDAELIWNLKETATLATTFGYRAELVLDADRGHVFPLKGSERAPEIVASTPARAAEALEQALSAPLVADAARVESPWLRIDAVKEERVAVPARVPVDGAASPDAQRRRTLKAYEKAVVRLTPKLERRPAGTTLTLTADGVTAAVVNLRAPWFVPGVRTTVRAKGVALYDAPLAVDRAALLRDARRTGERLRPTLRAVSATF